MHAERSNEMNGDNAKENEETNRRKQIPMINE